MKVLNLIYEDFTNYKKPSMFIGMGTCDFKCCKEAGISPDVCQNYQLQHDFMEVSVDTIVGNYESNNISEAIVIGGLEPFNDYTSLYELVEKFREVTNDDIVIYTGYYPYELCLSLLGLRKFDNIIVKFGRYVPDDEPRYDKLLGVELSSSNQFGMNIKGIEYDIIR